MSKIRVCIADDMGANHYYFFVILSGAKSQSKNSILTGVHLHESQICSDILRMTNCS